MFAAFADRLIRVHDRFAGEDRQVLRFGSESHQEKVAGFPVGNLYLLQARLRIERPFQLAIRGYGSVSVDVEALRADRLRHMNRHAGAIEANSDPPALVAEGRIQALARSGDDFVCGHHPPCPTVAYVLLSGTHRSPPKLGTFETVVVPFQRFWQSTSRFLQPLTMLYVSPADGM